MTRGLSEEQRRALAGPVFKHAAGLRRERSDPNASFPAWHLRRLDDAGRLEYRTLLEVSEMALFRREHKLVKAQIAWLDATARQHHERGSEVLRAVAAAFGQESAELQRRALTVARRHARHADAATLAELATAAAALRPALRDRAAAAFGAPPRPCPVADERAAGSGGRPGRVPARASGRRPHPADVP